MPWIICERCDNWLSGEVYLAFDGRAYCLGPCAPWAQVPSPLAPLLTLGARVLERLDREGLPRERAATVVAWAQREAARWPGRRPWLIYQHAGRARLILEGLLTWRPEPEPSGPRSRVKLRVIPLGAR
ncbi:MAG: hypothetical protein MUF34_19980 [Polyangiaceae bacterium]|jgi:hypothetical protein|nr:hypothetical protein [Polyangiaceae bacterium]